MRTVSNNGVWVCQGEFWKISKSPHKRREEVAQGEYKGCKQGYFRWESKPCEHGIARSNDYRLRLGTLQPGCAPQSSQDESTSSPASATRMSASSASPSASPSSSAETPPSTSTP